MNNYEAAKLMSFSEEEVEDLNNEYASHCALVIDEIHEDAKRKIPKHWAKFVIFSPPHSGVVLKGVQCTCGFESYYVYEDETKSERRKLYGKSMSNVQETPKNRN